MNKPTVLITGCSDNGIGSSLALSFHAKNHHVFATARNPAKMSALRDLPNITFLTLDVTKKEHIQEAVDAVKKHTGGKLDHLVNNAGAGKFMPTLDQDLDAARDLFEGNLWGPIALTQVFSPLLIEAKGKITFITSIAGYVNVPFLGAYAASKRSMEIMAETLRLELAPFGVRVLSVVTGAVESAGYTRGVGFELPEGSLYKPIEGVIGKKASGGDDISKEDTMVYAGKVVDEVVDGNKAKFWCGNHAGFAKYATAMLPGFVMVSFLFLYRWLADDIGQCHCAGEWVGRVAEH